MQQAEEAAAETEAERLRHLRLVAQRGVIELQLLQRLAQRVVLVRLDRIEPREDLRLDLLEARQRRAGRPVDEGQRIADLRRLQLLDARDDVADLARTQHVARHRLGREHADLLAEVGRTGRHQANAVLVAQAAIDDPHQHDDADVVVEPGIDQQSLQRRLGISLGCRNAFDDRLEDVLDTKAGLRRREDRLRGIEPDDVLDLLPRLVRHRRRQIDLVQDRHDVDTELDRRVAVGDSLRLDALRGIDDEQRAFAGRQRTRHLIREIDMSGSVDQVQVVHLATARAILQRSGLRLDGDAALALDVHRVEHLRLHLAIGEATAEVDDAIGECRLAVIDVRDDGKVTNVLHLH